MVSGQARLRGWSSSSSSSSRILGKMSGIRRAECAHIQNIYARLSREGHTSSTSATPFMGGVTSTETFVLLGMFLSALGQTERRELILRPAFFFFLKWITGLIREILKLSTVILSWRLCLRDGSYVEKQNTPVIFFNLLLPPSINERPFSATSANNKLTDSLLSKRTTTNVWLNWKKKRKRKMVFI